ncbi:MAG: hypothetical protein AAFR88_01075 [Pseudomonadota bacterium]
MTKAVFYLVLLITAIGTAGLQLDRQSAASPALASSVPEPFRAFAQARLTAAAIREGSPQLALAEAEKLVIRRPVPSQSMRLVAIAQYGSGDAEAGLLSIQIAAQRGWRDRTAQEMMLRLAMAAGDWPEAALRYAALLANNEVSDEVLEETAGVLFTANNAEAIARIVEIARGADRWRGQLLRRAGRLMPERAYAELVEGVLDKLDEQECNIVFETAKRLRRTNETGAQRIEEIAQGHCARA